MTKAPSRATVTISGLEKTITAAVQQSSPDCQSFVGIYLEPSSNYASGTNWALKGVKYGRAPRLKCDAAIEEIVKNLQDRYLIEPTRSIPNPKQLISSQNATRQNMSAVSPLAAAFKRIAGRP